jgi:hypothetical protein
LTFALFGCAASNGISEDQKAVLETVASEGTGDSCVQPILRGTLDELGSRAPPNGFRDLVDPSQNEPDVRYGGDRIGNIRVADNADCIPMLLPRVSGDRAMTAIMGSFPIGFGLRRIQGRWMIVERSIPDIY